jgi:hypothetical protein
VFVTTTGGAATIINALSGAQATNLLTYESVFGFIGVPCVGGTPVLVSDYQDYGGPGFNGYDANAYVYCLDISEDCGVRFIAPKGPNPRIYEVENPTNDSRITVLSVQLGLAFGPDAAARLQIGIPTAIYNQRPVYAPDDTKP